MLVLSNGGLEMIRFTQDESPIHDKLNILAEDASMVKSVQRLVEVHVRLQLSWEQFHDWDERAMDVRPLWYIISCGNR